VRRLAVAAVAATVTAAAVGAFAYVRAADEPTGYVGKGQVVIQTTIGGTDKLTVGGNIALEERGQQLRIDILSLGIPGAGSTINALMTTELFPPGGFTIVYDRKSQAYSVWSNAKQRYYSNASSTAPETSSPVGAVGAAVAAGGNLFSAFSFARSLKDDSAFTVSLGLAGHSTVNGHPATGLNFQYARTTKGGDAIDLHGTFQIADDLDGVPVEITAAGHSKSIPPSAFRLDFTTLQKATPPDEDFEVPAGYSRVNNLGEVIGRSLPGL
jgi:hypothetical protein